MDAGKVMGFCYRRYSLVVDFNLGSQDARDWSPPGG